MLKVENFIPVEGKTGIFLNEYMGTFYIGMTYDGYPSYALLQIGRNQYAKSPAPFAVKIGRSSFEAVKNLREIIEWLEAWG